MRQAQNDRTDAAMLQSMAASLRAGMGFSFNPMDMANLLDRVAANVAPGPKLATCDVPE